MQKIFMLFILLLFITSSAFANHDSQRVDNFESLPDSNNRTFRTDSRNMWEHEDARRAGRYHSNFVYSGGTHPVAATLTTQAFATEAFVPEHLNQSAIAITYAAIANDVCWTIVSSDNNGITGWTRVGTTAYYYQCEGDTTPNIPDLPTNSAWLMRVTVTSNAITVVVDMRSFDGRPFRTLNPRMPIFGGVCNGVANDASALTSIFSAASTTGSGTIIEIPGICRTDVTLTIPAELTIRGANRTTSRIDLTTTTNSQVLLHASDRTTIEHMTLRVNGNDQIALSLLNTQEVTLNSVIVTSAITGAGVGVHIRSTVGAGSYNGNIKSSQFEGLLIGLRLGLSTDTIGANVWTLSGNKFTSNNTGLLVEEATGVTIVGGEFESNTAFGIDASSTTGSVCANINIFGTYFEANTTNHIRTSSLCSNWIAIGFITVGGSYSDPSGIITWYGDNSGNPNTIFRKNGWSLRNGQLNIARTQSNARKFMISGSRTLIDAGVAASGGLLDVILSSIAGEDDAVSIRIEYAVTSTTGASRSIETGTVDVSVVQDTGANVGCLATKAHSNQRIAAGMATYVITIGQSTGTNTCTVTMTAETNVNVNSEVHFTAWILFAARSSGSASINLVSGVTDGS